MPTLIDGREVDSASESYRHECEARFIAARPSLEVRRQWLNHIDRKRGRAEGDRLRRTISQLWERR